jgi:hypothetical protein
VLRLDASGLDGAIRIDTVFHVKLPARCAYQLVQVMGANLALSAKNEAVEHFM